MKGKIQTQLNQESVLVEIEGGLDRNFYAGNKKVEFEKLTEEQILQEFQKIELTLKEIKDILSKREGFAISSIKDVKSQITFNDLVKFTYEN